LRDRDRSGLPARLWLFRAKDRARAPRDTRCVGRVRKSGAKRSGRNVWQFGVVGGKDEALLLYVRQTEFLDPDLAAVKWKAGFLDGLVVAQDELPDLLPRLKGATPSRIGMSEAADGSGGRYIFLLCSGL